MAINQSAMNGRKFSLISLLVLSQFFSFCNQPPDKSYSELVADINAKKIEFSRLYERTDLKGQAKVITDARGYLFGIISTDVFNFWYGTKWDFSGMTRVPGKGNIACGYFVTNVLTDAGFKIPRIKWAQSASEVFISRLAKMDIARFSNKTVAEVEAWLKKTGDGIYLVGLDSHTGFIVVKSNSIKFIHSNYYQREIGVMSQQINSDNPFKDSNYRVIGKLLSDEMMRNWITGFVYK